MYLRTLHNIYIPIFIYKAHTNDLIANIFLFQKIYWKTMQMVQ